MSICTRATLDAFGIEADPEFAVGVVDELIRSRRRLRWAHSLTWAGRTLKDFLESHPRGAFFLFTHAHAMALVDGVLTDTTERGPDGRRIIVVVEVLD